MARLFLTNIDLNTNELQNAVIQNLSSAPQSGNKEGRIYYDVTAKALYLYTNGSWKPLASGGTAASSLELTGDVTGTANVDPTTGKITLETTVVNNSVALGDDTTGDYVQQVHGTANQISVDYESGEGVTATISLPSYINIANGEMHLKKTEYWIDDWQYGIIAANASSDAFSIASTNYPLQLESHTGNIQLLPDSGIVELGTGFGELHLQKTEYWRDGTQQGIIAAQSDGSLRITGNNNGLQLETNSGDITISPNSNNLYVNGNITTNGSHNITASNRLFAGSGIYVGGSDYENDGFINIQDYNGNNVITFNVDGNTEGGTGTATIKGNLDIYGPGPYGNRVGHLHRDGDDNLVIDASQNNLILTSDSGNVVINNTLVTDNITSKNGGEDSLYIQGGYSNIHLDNSNGNIEINPDGIVYVNGGATFANSVTITGDLNVQGTLNAVNRTEINIEDNTIRLNTGFTGAPTADAGIIVERGTANDTAIIWSESNDQWTLTNDGSNYFAIARKFVSVIGDASNTSFDVVHNLGTRDITVQVRENNAEYNLVETDVLFKDNNTVTIGFTDAPTANAYKVIIVG